MAQFNSSSYTSTLQTTDGTVTAIVSIPIGTNQSIVLWGSLVGDTNPTSNAVAGNFVISARRAAGNVLALGTPYLNVNTTSGAAFSFAFDTGTNTVRVTVTGTAATTFNWICNYNYQLETI